MENKVIATKREIKEAVKSKTPIEIYRHIWGTHGTHGRRVVLTFSGTKYCSAAAEETDKKDALGNHVWESAGHNSSMVLSEALTVLCQEIAQEK